MSETKDAHARREHNRRGRLRSLEGETNNEKPCYACGQVRSITEYQTRRRTGKLSLLCIACRQKASIHMKSLRDANRPQARKRIREFKRQRKAQWKMGLSCQTCGENHPACLDFHHRDPKEKDFDISHAIDVGVSDELIAVEVAKCDVLCRNCHTKLHWYLCDAQV